ncbi:hypothetical protein KAFR_0J01780 [Kazachstania africana CBS 2517]|uniref:HORMA domain-containing protein n=1 Tax=Kazachstania africana (strain ATCC 22294 / BCRC 22015 / CBS 2517 / CECT 1963 / NBRC 1671 / NRRL Y-8276) TaxID=1071382 RepID=H2B0U2_KAZAF|nr:hypothetical protein KAFR_0J01780 [Kazachstania africana CBS 2517]CCF60242.1 hypothetical protein KAFR_0J01780 [Kazachstania africana CBS 2517]
MNKWIAKWFKIYLKSYINLILYHRNVYPANTFTSTTFQAFNLPQFVPINRNPSLQSYIEELIDDLLSKLSHIYRINICINDAVTNLCLEKYVLDFSEFKHVENDSMPAEGEVFDEFRSSLNSLISKLEKLRQIKDGSVVFEIVINAIELELGHSTTSFTTDKKEMMAFDRENNWTKCQEDENLPKEDYEAGNFQPKIKMTSLVGCDIGPFIVHNFYETLISGNAILSSIYMDNDE